MQNGQIKAEIDRQFLDKYRTATPEMRALLLQDRAHQQRMEEIAATPKPETHNHYSSASTPSSSSPDSFLGGFAGGVLGSSIFR